MTIRPAVPADLDTICDFNRRLAHESEGKDLDPAQLRPGVAAVFADPHKGVYFLAEEDGAPIGQLCLTYEWSDWRNGWFWWIQSVYVVAEARRRGVFRRLYAHVAELARRDPLVVGLRLYVEADNAAAHATYENLGLTWTTYRVMERYPLEGTEDEGRVKPAGE
jgi:GNAT superfamily N-acetyltransferase